MRRIDPLVSVIIPTLDRPEYLAAAVSSVLRQSAQNFEVLVIDDGSAANLRPVLEALDDGRIRYVRHDSNRGEAVGEDAYLPLRLLAGYSGFSERTLRGFLRRQNIPLPYYQIDGKIVLRRSEFDCWMASFRRGPILSAARDQERQMVDEILRDLTAKRPQADNPARTMMGGG